MDRNVIKGMLRKIGLDVRLTKNIESRNRLSYEERWRSNWRYFQRSRVRTIIDIGANTGLFTHLIHPVFPEARIIAFEPLPSCFAELERNLSVIPGAEAIQCALGEVAGILEINQSDFSPSSSFLDMTELHVRNWPESAEGSRLKVRTERLDDILADRHLEEEILIKIDVQGFEDRVIRGGAGIISRAGILVVEVCFAELYAGQPLFREIYGQLHELGFVFRGHLEQHVSELDGSILFADALFTKEQSAS